MSEELQSYLSESYRADVLGESVHVRVPNTSTVLAEAKEELKRIAALRLSDSDLASRAFVSYQAKRALERLVRELGG